MIKVFVTVGMSRWPFDRLINAVKLICPDYEVFVQTGVSEVKLSCRTRPFIPYYEVICRIKEADVVIMHGGNCVRLAQRLNKYPIVMARQAEFNEMANNHQVHYLKLEEKKGNIIPLWDPASLPELIKKYLNRSGKLLKSGTSPPPLDHKKTVEIMDRLCVKWIK